MFQFRLQSVLEVRERLSRIKQKEFSEVLYKRQQMELEIEQRHGALSRASSFVDKGKRASLSLHPLEMFQAFKQRLDSEIDLIAEQMREQDQQLEERRRALVEAKRAQRTLEILREKAQNRYEKELNRRERAIMDEVGSNYFIFNNR